MNMMTQKTIALPEDVYLELKKQKRKDETFPDLIRRLIQRGKKRDKDLDSLAGALAEDNEWDAIVEDLYNDRQRPARLE